MAEHVCPWWVGYLLASPLRRLFQKPEQILDSYIREGMTVLEPGCAMGFFSLPMARMVGSEGRIVCVDLQQRMLDSLMQRARKAGLADRIEARSCAKDGLGIEDLSGRIDFALAFAMVHEVPDPDRLLSQIRDALAPGGRLLIAEPAGHVSGDAFEKTVKLATEAGLATIERPRIAKSHAVLMAKPG
ncbi:MAG: methyltransferase domain-containing protein [Deltaproteobacteria bacterium]|nr:methyltransferase domain-containing protein [Deltaproteobacteria bacterium]